MRRAGPKCWTNLIKTLTRPVTLSEFPKYPTVRVIQITEQYYSPILFVRKRKTLGDNNAKNKLNHTGLGYFIYKCPLLCTLV